MNKKKIKNKECTPRQLAFCYEYIANKFNETVSYKKIYDVKSDSVAATNASRLLKNAKVQKKIRELTSKYFKTLGCKTQDILNELAILGFSTIKNFVEWDEGGKHFTLKSSKEIGNKINCINEINVIENEFKGVKTTKIKLKLHDRTKALELLGKHSDLFKIEDDELKKKGDVLLHIEPEDIQGKDPTELAKDYQSLLRSIQKGK